jgi:hypothetical protein
MITIIVPGLYFEEGYKTPLPEEGLNGRVGGI